VPCTADEGLTVRGYSSVAIVDDDESIRKALQRLLTACGTTVTTFASGQDFIDSMSAYRPDCPILDLDMPGMTSTDVQRRLTESDMRVPVIIIAGRDDRETEARCRAAGAAAYLPKPIDERILLDTLAIVVRKD